MRGGAKEVQEKGEALARQGRLRLDIFNLQRRLDRQLESLGRIYVNRVQEGQSVSPDDPKMSPHLDRIQEIEKELAAFREDLHRSTRKPGD